ncbi:Hypothetical protein A7982_04767 [Minicystis rosea]|nr:Hypothetical protein A7982_04767 [Minicystis rosea]
MHLGSPPPPPPILAEGAGHHDLDLRAVGKLLERIVETHAALTPLIEYLGYVVAPRLDAIPILLDAGATLPTVVQDHGDTLAAHAHASAIIPILVPDDGDVIPDHGGVILASRDEIRIAPTRS